MEINQDQDVSLEQSKRNHRRGRIMGGIIIILIGKVLLLKELGFNIPSWIFTWQMLVIAISVFVGAKRLFRPGGWLVGIAIGSLFLVDDLIPNIEIGNLIWPVVLILVGISMLFFKGKDKHRHHHRWGRYKYSKGGKQWVGEIGEESVSDFPDDMIDVTAIFSASRRNIISKSFKGGTIACVFGGAEVNMMQADISGEVRLDVSAVFGGVKIIVPSHWHVRNELTAVMGGVEDERPTVTLENPGEAPKVLLLTGAAVFGGVEIVSYM